MVVITAGPWTAGVLGTLAAAIATRGEEQR
jgi:hypothetical protein